MYGRTNTGVRHLDKDQIAISDELAALCPRYIDSLGLKDSEGKPVTSDNYMDYLKTFIMASAQKALEEGCEIPDTIGIVRYTKPRPSFAQMLGAGPVNGGAPADPPPASGRPVKDRIHRLCHRRRLEQVSELCGNADSLEDPAGFRRVGCA